MTVFNNKANQQARPADEPTRLALQDEGVDFTPSVSTINFTGDGVNLTETNGVVNARITGTNIGSIALDDISNVEAPNPTGGQALVFDADDQLWVAGAGGGGSETLADLTDVQLTNPQNNQILRYNTATDDWINVNAGGIDAEDLADLGDVVITNATTGQLLEFDADLGDNGQWKNANSTAVVVDLDDIGDVQITNPTTGQFLEFDADLGTNGEWKNADAAEGLTAGAGIDITNNVVSATVVSADSIGLFQRYLQTLIQLLKQIFYVLMGLGRMMLHRSILQMVD